MKKLLAALSLAFLAAACVQPPTQEINDAQTAINTAITAGAQDYAPDALRAAQDALTAANTQVDAKDFKSAKASAMDAKTKADAAQSGVETGKAQAKAELGVKIKDLREKAKAAVTLAAKSKNKTYKQDAGALSTEVENLVGDSDSGKFKTAMDKAANIESAMKELTSKIETSLKGGAKKGGAKKK